MAENYEDLVHEISSKIESATKEFADMLARCDLDEQEEQALQELNDFLINLAESNKNTNPETIEEDTGKYMADALYILTGFKFLPHQTPTYVSDNSDLRTQVEFLKHKNDIKIIIINLALALSFFPITIPAYFITAAATKSWAAFYNPANPVKELQSELQSELTEFQCLIYLSAKGTEPLKSL